MNSARRHGENSAYLVILLLVVGLTAFSHSMKELAEIHQLTLDASRLVAQWSGNITPAEVPQASVQIATVVKIEKLGSCESRQSAPSLELPWLNEAPEQTVPSAVVVPARPRQPKAERAERTERRVISIPGEGEIAKLRKLQHIGIGADAFEVRIPDEPIVPDFPSFTFKTKTRKPSAIKFNPRDREMILKTLNRSINLRSAS